MVKGILLNKKSLFLGLDLGTSSLKAIVVDEKGKIKAVARRGYSICSPQTGWAEQDPEEWWRATLQVIQDLTSTGVDFSLVKGIGLSGQTHGMVIVDKNFRPLRKAIIWLDQRSYSQIKRIDREKLNRMTQITGIPLYPGFMASSILWMRDSEPHLLEKARYFLLPKDYLRIKLTHQAATDVSDAAGTFLLDTRKRSWSEYILGEVGISKNLLPPLYESTEITGSIAKDVSERTHLPEGVPLCAGGADQVMGAVGNKIVEDGDSACIVGTGGQLVSCISQPLVGVDKGLHTIPHAVKERWILMGAILSAGISLSWFINRVLLDKGVSGEDEVNWDLLIGTVPSYPAIKKGLFFLPYLKGERTPHLDPGARGLFIGLCLDHSRGDLIRAIMEGVAFAFRDCIEMMRLMGISPGKMICSGGGGKNKIWRQILSDVLGVSLYSVNSREQSAYGAALTAAVATGFFSSLKEGCNEWIDIYPDTSPSAFSSLYQQGYRIYRQFYPLLKEKFHLLSKMEKDYEAVE